MEPETSPIPQQSDQHSRSTLQETAWPDLDDPRNPRNWTTRKKWTCTFVVSGLSVIPPISSSIVAPALPVLADEMGVTSSFEQQLVLSSFVLAAGVGSLWLGPLSEVYGRVWLLQCSNAASLVLNLACGFSCSPAQLITFRFLSGLLGSASMAVDEGVLTDIWSDEDLGKSVALYGIASLLSPVIGPILGGILTAKTSWRWVFFIVSILSGLMGLLALMFLRETYAPRILTQLAKKEGHAVRDVEARGHDAIQGKNAVIIMWMNLARPVRLLGTQVIIQLLALYLACLYGLLYLVLSTFTQLWTDVYGERLTTASLNYISMGIGLVLGSQFGVMLSDRIYMRLKRRNDGIGIPEHRLPVMIPCSFLIPIGFFWYGWCAQAKTHWVLPNIGVVLFSTGIVVLFLSIQLYIIDAYPRYTASALASTIILRSILGFTFPLFAPSMYEALGYGWGNSVLAFVALAGVPAPILLWKLGPALRARSAFSG